MLPRLGGHKVGRVIVTNLPLKRTEFFELLLRECGPRKSYRVMGLSTGTRDRSSTIPALIHTLKQLVEVCSSLSLSKASTEGTIGLEISWMTLASFLSCIFSATLLEMIITQ